MNLKDKHFQIETLVLLFYSWLTCRWLNMMRTALITCLNSVGEAKLLWLDVALWWGQVQTLYCRQIYQNFAVSFLWNTKATGPKTMILQSYKEQIPTIQKYFSQSVASLSTVYLKKLKKNYYSGLLLSCVWVRLAKLVIQHIVSLPCAWWQWPPERGIVGSALRRWRWNQTLLPRHLQGKATES